MLRSSPLVVFQHIQLEKGCKYILIKLSYNGQYIIRYKLQLKKLLDECSVSETNIIIK